MVPLPATEVFNVPGPAGWFTPAMLQLALPVPSVVPLQVCAPMPLPRVKVIISPEIGELPWALDSTAERLAALLFVNVVGPL